MRAHRNLSIVSALTLLLSLSPVTLLAGPLDDGLRAFETKQYSKALALWSPLAQQGNRDAQYNLALLYANGWGTARNMQKAIELYTAAARQGQADAQYNLGLIYQQGKEVFRSDREALQWWELAAAQNHPAAQFNLGVMYAYGRGVAVDVEKTLKLWEQSANQGYQPARQALVDTFEQGLLGVKRDAKRANSWKGNPAK